MGKKRITQLLDQLQANQQQDLQNAAAIFTVAQVAVNQLQLQASSEAINSETISLPAASEASLPATAAPMFLSEAELRQRYGTHTACRQAAKKQGIVFKKTPTWQQLGAAFAYFEAYQKLVQVYMQMYPNRSIEGVSFQIQL